MTGTIVSTHLGCVNGRREPAGGEIRAPGLPERVCFLATELVGLPLCDALGLLVEFDLTSDGWAIRVRPAKG